MANHFRIFSYKSFHINKSQSLGHGSYGAVYKAKCDQLPCAAKVLHPTILDPTDPGAGKIMERFQQECGFLESIRHPNIVQYLGMTRDPESRLPVLLMELLDESLTKMLERSQQSLAYYIQVDVCHDIALAVAYLHSNDIIHRDLSSNNVLMIAGRRAKVTDFGMSKLAGTAPSMTPLTMCPGTLAYMPPEALREPPRYTKKLDCFSEGVIMIQVCTRLWPEPGPRTQLVQDSRSPMGVIEMPVSEIDRRKDHIDLIDPNHALLLIAKDCLHFQEKDRPSSEELCQRLAGLKETGIYRESVQQLQEKDILLQQRQDEIATQTHQILQLRQQLEEQEQVTAEIQQTNHSLQRQVEQLKRQLSQQNLKPPPPSQAQVRGGQLQDKQLPVQPSLQVDHKPHPHSIMKMTLNWRDGRKVYVPFEMSRGAAVVDGDIAYFMNYFGEVCSYSFTSKKWSKFLKCPHSHSSLAVVDRQLTAIGGYDNGNTCTNKLLSLPYYREAFPAMPTKRASTTAVTSKEHLIVAGGSIRWLDADKLNVVEVMDTKSLVWSTVASLPHPYSRASGTICGDQLYMLGGADDETKTKSVLTCSLTELLQSSSSSPSSRRRRVAKALKSSSSSSSSIWHRVADAPAYLSTCAAVNGELLAVGGCDKDWKPSSTIHKYNPTTNSWDLIGNMPTARWYSLVAVFLPQMMIVGGNTVLGGNNNDKIEIANFSLS